jgi:hypothetical protein
MSTMEPDEGIRSDERRADAPRSDKTEAATAADAPRWDEVQETPAEDTGSDDPDASTDL